MFPDVPGCAVLAETEQQAAELIREAIQLHLEDLRTKNLPASNRRQVNRGRNLCISSWLRGFLVTALT
jgi:predicted DNA-binding protein